MAAVSVLPAVVLGVMGIVVADTGPLRYLVLIGHVEVLPRLFGAVSIPATVADELRQPPCEGGRRHHTIARPWLRSAIHA